ncbi:Chemotaxis protein CheA [Amantichitinum ursilacus]|uniref:Chemotaxis protein CheA n=2 Tax=Amantichitinum ursilacus TaxID=857265 RepID=A0A0N0XJP5_9NEIS|nr:Chemotaxis protein CheA [Amantichitinum ursilacus]
MAASGLDQFLGVFLDEADEHLATVETLLLGLENQQPDAEDQNAIFRAAHSIKGGAATFGLPDVAELTHEVESLLDEVRHGERALDRVLFELVLEAVDVIKLMLSDYRQHGRCLAPHGVMLLPRLRDLLGNAVADAPVVRANAQDESPTRCTLVAPAGESVDIIALLELLGDFRDSRLLPPDNPDQPIVIDCATAADASRLQGVLARELRGCTIILTPLTAAQVADDEGFGLFDDEPVRDILDDGFGLFDDEPTAPADVLTDADFGLFDSEPVVASNAMPVPAAETPFAGFGLFEPAPPKPVAQKVSETVRAAETRAAETIRVNVDKVDQLLNLIGELVITQSMLAQYSSELDPTRHERLLAGVEQLQRNSRDLQESVMAIRMLPVSNIFSRFPRLVRETATRLDKKVTLKLVGESTEIDKGFIEKLADPLTHLIRNSLDHGVETPAHRLQCGKPETATLTLRAFHQGGHIVIQVIDDGAGLDRARILAKAKERNLPAHDGMHDEEVWNLIFEPGFSTAATVNDLSGRGVGMDVVRRNIQQMGGRVDIQSCSGIGTTISLYLPLTLAILDGMAVEVAGETYIVPLTYIAESLQPREQDIKQVSGKGCLLQIRENYVPLASLAELLGTVPGKPHAHEGLCMVLQNDDRQLAVCVDDLLGQHQVVIKSLEANYRKVPYISGATIMGDGRVALILDVESLFRTGRSVSTDPHASTLAA